MHIQSIVITGSSCTVTWTTGAYMTFHSETPAANRRFACMFLDESAE